jgi:hypothetical protein
LNGTKSNYKSTQLVPRNEYPVSGEVYSTSKVDVDVAAAEEVETNWLTVEFEGDIIIFSETYFVW